MKTWNNIKMPAVLCFVRSLREVEDELRVVGPNELRSRGNGALDREERGTTRRATFLSCNSLSTAARACDWSDPRRFSRPILRRLAPARQVAYTSATGEGREREREREDKVMCVWSSWTCTLGDVFPHMFSSILLPYIVFHNTRSALR